MRKYGCLQGIVMSFYSPRFYRDVAKNWGGGVVLYLLLVLTLCWIALAFQIQKSINVRYDQFSEKIFPQIPPMTINQGKLKTPENRPYKINDTDNQVIAIIDTSGQYKNLTNTKALLLVTENQVIYKGHSDVEKVHQFHDNFNLEIIPLTVKQALRVTVNWLWILFLPVLLFFSCIYRLIQAALYAILGELIAVLSHISLTYGEIFKLTIFAITPSIIIGTIFEWFGITFHFMWLFYFVLSMGYLTFAIHANK